MPGLCFCPGPVDRRALGVLVQRWTCVVSARRLSTSASTSQGHSLSKLAGTSAQQLATSAAALPAAATHHSAQNEQQSTALPAAATHRSAQDPTSASASSTLKRCSGLIQRSNVAPSGTFLRAGQQGQPEPIGGEMQQQLDRQTANSALRQSPCMLHKLSAALNCTGSRPQVALLSSVQRCRPLPLPLTSV